MKPLCVTWRSPARNSLGQKNLNNLIKLGVDHIDFSINYGLEKKFIYKTFKMFGNPLIPMHLALHAIPTQIALEKNIPLILWRKIQHMNMEVQNPTKVNLWITSGEKFFWSQ